MNAGQVGEFPVEALVVVVDNLLQRLLLDEGPINLLLLVVDGGINEHRRHQLGRHLLEQMVVIDGLRDGMRGEDRVELAESAQGRPVLLDIGHHLALVLGHIALVGRAVLALGHHALDTVAAIAHLVEEGRHRHLVHDLVVHALATRVAHHLLHRFRLRLVQGHSLTQVKLGIGCHGAGVESEHVAVTDTIGDAVAVELVTEHVGGGAQLLAVFLVDGRARKAEHQRPREHPLDGLHVLTEGRTMALVHDEHDALLANRLQVARAHGILVDVSHLLNGRDNECVGRVAAFQLRLQDIGALRGLNCLGIVGEGTVLLERLRSQLYAIDQEHHFVGILRIGDELGALEAGHGLAAACGMPDEAALEALGPPQLIAIDHRHAIGDAAGRVVLVAAHHLQHAVGIVGHGVIADKLVRHGDTQQMLDDLTPLIDGVVVKVGPMKLELFVEDAIGAGISEVLRLLGVHGDEYLHQREQSFEYALSGIFANLADGLRYWHTALLQLDVEQGHAIDEQHKVAAAVVAQLRLRRKHRLLGYLVAALSPGDLVAVENLEGHLLTDVQPIVDIIPRDDDLFAVDQLVNGHRRALRPDLLDDLLHLSGRQRRAVQTVAVLVVLEENGRPVPHQLLLGRVLQHAARIVPAIGLQLLDNRFLECRFCIENHRNLSPALFYLFSRNRSLFSGVLGSLGIAIRENIATNPDKSISSAAARLASSFSSPDT